MLRLSRTASALAFVIACAAASFAKAKDIPLDGKPFNIVAVGGSGETH